MDAHRFDALARSLTAGSRRGVLAATLGAVIGTLGLTSVDAKKKKKPCPPCKKRKKGKCKKNLPDGTGCSGGTCQGGSCVAAPPSPQWKAACGYDGTSKGYQGSQRYAQTFPAPGSGPLTTATIGLLLNPAAFSLTFEIRAVDQFGLPATTALASTTVSNIPLTALGPTARNVSATFPSPATLVLGQTYTLVVTGPANASYGIHANNGSSGIDFCTDGKAFYDEQATNNFQDPVTGIADLVYTVTVG